MRKYLLLILIIIIFFGSTALSIYLIQRDNAALSCSVFVQSTPDAWGIVRAQPSDPYYCSHRSFAEEIGTLSNGQIVISNDVSDFDAAQTYSAFHIEQATQTTAALQTQGVQPTPTWYLSTSTPPDGIFPETILTDQASRNNGNGL